MDEPSTPGSPRDRRAVDGLDWSAPHTPEARDPETPQLVSSDVEPSVAAPAPHGGSIRWLQPVLIALVAGLIGGLAGAGAVRWLDDGNSGAAPAAAGTTAPTVLTVEQTSAVADVASRTRPGVVRIDSTHRTNGGVEQDVGSGIVYDPEGHIVTNAHVIEDAENITVTLADGTKRPAIVLGTDYPYTDVAVLQIGPTNVPPIPPGDSSALVLGQAVIAIGNPLADFEGSVTVGVVSGLNRSRNFDGVRQDDLIQTDAAINNGNSGGVLLNLEGQFVGIPTAVLRETPGGLPVEGIAFVLPTNRVIPIVTRIIADGASYPRPSLAADVRDITPDTPVRGRPSITDGAVVVGIQAGGAADAAGIVLGDVITKVGQQNVDQANPILNVLMQHQPGETVRVVLNRNGRIIETDVRLGKSA